LRVDDAIEREILRVLAPRAIEAALLSRETAIEETTANPFRALELELREARYEAERATAVRRSRARPSLGG
jgi:hypothetical protein